MIALEEWRRRANSFDAHGWRIASWVSTADSDGTSPGGEDERPWLLLIHGFPTSSWDWSAVWPTLSARFNLAAVDMLGFGLSDKPRNIEYRIADQADLQEILFERLGQGETHILAHDYGDTVAQELLARHLEGSLSVSLKSIVFLNGGLFPEAHHPRPIQKLGLSPLGPLISRALSRNALRKGFDDIFGAQTKASDEEIDAHWALITENGGQRIFHKLLNYMRERKQYRARWVGALQNAAIPMRLINGGADPVSGKHLYEYYKNRIPNADAHLLPDIGHYPQTEDPAAVCDLVFDFHEAIGTFRQ